MYVEALNGNLCSFVKRWQVSKKNKSLHNYIKVGFPECERDCSVHYLLYVH